MKMKKLDVVLVIGYMVLIFYFSSLKTIPGTGGSDLSLFHIPEYFVLSFLLLRLFSGNVWLAVSFATAYGILDEVHQHFVGRTFSAFDIFLDLAGASLIVLIISAERIILKQHSKC